VVEIEKEKLEMENLIPIIIPAYEPDERMLNLIADLIQNSFQKIIIVNDGSGDEYEHFFKDAEEKYSVTILKHRKNRGKGAALKTAFKYCIENIDGLLGCVTADSDGQHTVDAIANCMLSLKKSNQKLILGVRDFTNENVPSKSRFGNNLTRIVFRKLYKKDISDTQTGLRGVPKRFMERLLDVPGDRFEFETKMLIEAVKSDIAIQEIPIETIYDSVENHSTHFRSIIDSVRIYTLFLPTFLKFSLSSFSSCLIDLLLFQTLCFALKTKWTVSYIAISTVGARIISAIYNYLLNYFWVFNSTSQHTKSAIKYFLLAIAQMMCSAIFVSILCPMVDATIELFIKIPVDVVLFLVSYKIQNKYIYRNE